jgi:hypothetical protein
MCLERIAALGVLPPTQKVEDYRQHAEECRMMARRSRSPEERDTLLNMAHTWDDLATRRAAQIAQKQRLKETATGPIDE